jgi:hypothetical protein
MIPTHSPHQITTTIPTFTHDKNTLAHLRLLRTPESTGGVPQYPQLQKVPEQNQ